MLTIMRVMVIPLIVASFYIEKPFLHWVAASLFILASVTDFLDGYLARAWSAQSRFGRFLDPIADKLLVVSVIVMLVDARTITGMQLIPALAIVCREILVSGLREFLAELNEAMPVTKLGKVKTTFQMTALLLLLLGEGGSGYQEVEMIGIALLWIAAVLTVISGTAYMRAGMQHM